MRDLVRRLRDPAFGTETSERNLMNQAADRIAQLEADNTRLRVENIQMQAALGYAICAEDERHIIPSNPFKCGVCDANRGVHDRIAQLEAALREVMDQCPEHVPYGLKNQIRALLGEERT